MKLSKTAQSFLAGLVVAGIAFVFLSTRPTAADVDPPGAPGAVPMKSLNEIFDVLKGIEQNACCQPADPAGDDNRSIFLKLGEIQGDVTAKEFDGQIECLSFTIGVDAPVSGVGAAREAGISAARELTVTRIQDSTSPVVYRKVCSGERLAEAIVTVAELDVLTKEYRGLYQIKLEDVVVSSMNTVADTHGGLLETLSLNFTKIEWSRFKEGQVQTTSFWNFETREGN